MKLETIDYSKPAEKLGDRGYVRQAISEDIRILKIVFGERNIRKP